MSFATYNCPVCGEEMERDLTRFLHHTNLHIYDKIKTRHPEWISSDGSCTGCPPSLDLVIVGS